MDQLLRFVNPNDGWLTEILALFVIPFIHEDVAILGAAFLIVEHHMPTQSAALSLYAGIVASDMALFGAGMLARQISWAQRILLKHGVTRFADWLGTHLTPVMILARLLPGIMFPAYIAIGFCRISFLRFAAITMLTAAIYLPVVLFLAENFGQGILSHLGYWSWVLVIAVVAIALWNLGRSPNWKLLFRGSEFDFGRLLRKRVFPSGNPDLLTHRGMPRLGFLPAKISLAEKMPPTLFYIPIVAQWIWLGLRHRSMSLPSLANPRIEAGGLWGESKSACLEMVGAEQRKWFADFTTIRRGRGDGVAHADRKRAREAILTAGLSFPLVAKPDIGWRGFGVQRIADEAGLDRYIDLYPEDETILFQRLVEWEGECGVLYIRHPDEAEGHIFSLTFRYFPHVVGDGTSSLHDLIIHDERTLWKIGAHLGLDSTHAGATETRFAQIPAAGEIVRLSFIGSNRVGGLYRDARAHITPALTRRFDEISRSMPDFYFGRFDARFSSVEQLEEGEGFQIIEINGAGGESINVWDPKMPLRQVYRELFEQQLLIFEIGARNRQRGFRTPGLLSLARSQWRQHRLILRYPPSS